MPVDLRARELAKLAVNYCVKLKKGENIIISGSSEAEPFIVELYKAAILAGAHPILRMTPANISDFFYKYASKEQIEHFPDHWFDTVKKAQAYIGIDTDSNTRELTSSDPEKLMARQKITGKISDYVVNTPDKIRRVTIAYPCVAHAIEAEMSVTEWENFIFKSCLIDWKKFSKKLQRINSIFEKGKNVWLKGENVDLKFSIEKKNSVYDDGKENMPGGEIFMAPARTSLNGWIKFEYPALYSGKEVSGIKLVFKDGKVAESTAEKNQDLLRSVIGTDKNSCYAGEFGIGCNPNITRFTKSLLFDEKISGTIHLALGMAYRQNGGGNDSVVHWDIVKDMKKAKIIVDGKVVQEKGIWKI
jgi:aminopeptidase